MIRRLLVLSLLLSLACSDDSGSGTVSPPAEDAKGGDGSIAVLPDSAGPDTSRPPQACTVGQECDDGKECTMNDTCVAGECVGELYECGDELECTRDRCDGKGGCFTELISGNWCLIGGVRYPDGSFNPDNPCQACITPVTGNM